MFGGLYSNASGSVDTPLFDNWVLGPSDPLQSKAEALVTFCYPDASTFAPGSQDAHDYNSLKTILTADNLQHFLEGYKNWHSHWPLIHMPSFNPINANHGLVLAMACIGAVYSDRLGKNDVRYLMELVRTVVHRSSNVYETVSSSQSHGVADYNHHNDGEVEEVQALVLLHALFVWHGSPKQRQQGRDQFWILANIARHVDLLHPLGSENPACSALHRPGPFDSNELHMWTWDAWVEQEKRIRVFYLVFLIDASLAIFFNVQPQFDLNEIELPLPADDAAWEANTREDCASALGLRGPAAQKSNITGSKRVKQIRFAEALHYLHNGGDFPQRSTNVYAKFVLIHAVHNQIFNIQRQIVNLTHASGLNGFSSSGTSTPQSQEWASADGTISNGSSGRATPIEGINQQFTHAHHKLRVIMGALESWKRAWDDDMSAQYPSHERRLGFCRDGIHFYYLARVFLRNSRREEWAAEPDVRCQQVFNLLRQIRAHVASDSAQKGLDIGSVTTVDDTYGIADLTLDMKLLFTPINSTSMESSTR